MLGEHSATDFPFGTSNSTGTLDFWGNPEFIRVQEVGESIELLYKQRNLLNSHTIGYVQPHQERVFKVVFSCVEGKWHRSEIIYGQILPAQKEDYVFAK
jgi:hypothetical protein